jgi:hypothetical protein
MHMHQSTLTKPKSRPQAPQSVLTKPKTRRPKAKIFFGTVTLTREGGPTLPFSASGDYGARYLDARSSRWISGDPALGEYVPGPGQGADKLPGMGGVYNPINFHVYHYAANNPVKYTDPDGRSGKNGSNIRPLEDGEWETVSRVRDETVQYLNTMINELNPDLYPYTGGNHVPSDLVQSAKQWLGVDLSNSGDARTLVNDLTKIRDNLAAKGRYDFVLNENLMDYAQVDPFFGGNTIELGKNFFSMETHEVSGAPHAHSVTKHGIFVHETTHFLSVLNTGDKANIYYRIRDLARDNPRGARGNSYNWEYFFVDYARKR